MLYIKGAGWTTDKSHKCLGIDSDITVYVEYQSVWKQSEGEVYTNLGMWANEHGSWVWIIQESSKFCYTLEVVIWVRYMLLQTKGLGMKNIFHTDTGRQHTDVDVLKKCRT